MEGRQLPVGWVVAPISELAIKVGSGATPKGGQSAYQPSGIPLIRSMNVVFFGFKKDGLAYINEDQAQLLSNAEVRQGDVLLNITGASIGRATSAPSWSEGARVNQHVCIIRPSESLIQDYLSAYLSSPSIQSFILGENYGVTRQALTKQQVLALDVPVPPLNEQRRIAAKLDTTLAAVDACRQRLDGVVAILKRFRQAVLAAATSGGLTREWREGREYGFDRWSIQDLCLNERYSLCIGPFGSNLKVSDYEEQGVPLVFVREIRTKQFGGPGTKYVTPAKALELIAHQVRPGDLLMTKMGDPPGDTAIYPDDMRFAIMTSDVVCIRPDPMKIDKVFLAYLLESPSGRDLIQDITAGVAQQKISLERLRSVVLMVPSLLEQEEIVRRIQQLFTLADQLEARLNAARKVVDRLTPALLAKAFRGELVPQDPNDEPASVLLERIRAARQAEAGAGKPSRRGRPKAAANPAPINRNAAPAPSEPLPPDLLTQLLRECGALSERALLAVSELEPERFEQQLFRELEKGTAREVQANGQVVLEAVG